MGMSEREKGMTIKQHLKAAEEAFPDRPKSGDVLAYYSSDMLLAERHLFLARLKMAKKDVGLQ